MSKVSLGILRLILAAAFVVLIAANARAVDQSAPAESSHEPTTQLDPPTPGVSGDEIFRELLQHNDMRKLSSNSIQQSELMKSETRAASCMRDRLCNWITALQTQKCS